MIKHRHSVNITTVILILTLIVTTITMNTIPVSAADVPSGQFDPAAATSKQGTYKSDKYYVFYNGDINTTMTDKGNKAAKNEGKFGKASVLVALDQEIVYIDDANAGQTLDAWIAAEEANEGVKIGSKTNEGADAVWIDLKGETVIPGLHDAHLHFESGGSRRYSPNIFWKSLAEIKIIIAGEVAKVAPGTWISASGWNQTLDTWDGGNKEFPSKEDLDEVAKEHPVVLGRTDGHANWANSIAIRMSPYGGAQKSGDNVTLGPEDPAKWPVNDKNDPLYKDPTGGTIIRDAKGMATGVFVDSAMNPVSEYRVNSATTDPNRNAKSADTYLRSYGLTSFMDAGTSQTTVDRYRSLYNSGDMKTRGYILIRNGTNDGKDNQVDVKFRADNPPIIGDCGDRLTVNATKITLDGALGSRGAQLNEPYADSGTAEVPTGYKGAGLRFTDDLVYQFIKRNLDAGWNIGGHGIGDASNDQYLDALEKYLEKDRGLTKDKNGYFDPDEVEKLGLRPRNEHYQILTKGAIERSAGMNLTASMQFVHATSDMSMAGDRVGEARLQYSYAWRKIVDSGMVISNGTDWAIDLLNPYHGLMSGVTRMDRDGKAPKSPRGVGVPWNPIDSPTSKASDERMTRAEALHYYSYGGAYSEFAEDIKGSLEEGKLADFVVIDRDYFDEKETPDFALKDINALLTVIGGEIVYGMKAPKITTDIIGDSRVGVPYAFTTNADYDFSPTLDWSIVERDPGLEWLDLDYHSGALTGTPTKAGTFKFKVAAKNYLGTDTAVLTMKVNEKDTSGQADISKASVTGLKTVAYTGKAKTPKVTVKLAGKVLKENSDYKVTHKNNIKVGKASVVITALGDKYKGTKTANYKIVPKKTSIKKVKAGKKKATVVWKKVKGTTKYQIRYKKSGSKKWKTKNVSAKASKITIKKLKAGKKYAFQVRSYKTVKKVKYYSSWSKTKTKKIK